MKSARTSNIAPYAFLTAVFAATAGPASGADALLPGTYGELSPATKRVMSVGNEVVFVRDRRGNLSFSLNAIRPSDNNLGYIGGTISRSASKVVWTSVKEGARCRLTFVALPHAMLQIAQDVRFGDCGFGYGVRSDGLYRRTRVTGKLGSWNGP